MRVRVPVSRTSPRVHTGLGVPEMIPWVASQRGLQHVAGKDGAGICRGTKEGKRAACRASTRAGGCRRKVGRCRRKGTRCSGGAGQAGRMVKDRRGEVRSTKQWVLRWGHRLRMRLLSRSPFLVPRGHFPDPGRLLWPADCLSLSLAGTRESPVPADTPAVPVSPASPATAQQRGPTPNLAGP